MLRRCLRVRGPRHHRRGVGRALYAALLDLLRRQGFVNAYAGIALPNPSSVAFTESFRSYLSAHTAKSGSAGGGTTSWLHLRLLGPGAPARATPHKSFME